jgi:hypothetical protein
MKLLFELINGLQELAKSSLNLWQNRILDSIADLAFLRLK